MSYIQLVLSELVMIFPESESVLLARGLRVMQAILGCTCRVIGIVGWLISYVI